MRAELRFAESSIEQCIAGTIVYPAGGTYGPLVYREIQLLLLHSGSMEVVVDGVSHNIVPGQIILLLPGQQISIAFDKQGPSEHRWITLLPGEYGHEVHEQFCAMPWILPISEQMNRLVDLAVLQQRVDNPEHRCVLNALGLAAVRLYAAESLSNSATIAHPLVREVKSLIQERYAEPLTMKDIAERINVSVSHLARVFKQCEQETPIQYLWRYRLETSLVLLRTTGLSIGEIAERSGFQSRYHFSRSVKRHTGKSASEMRAWYWHSRGGGKI